MPIRNPTQEEVDIINQLAEVYNKFVKLKVLHEADQLDFSNSIHTLQRIIMARPVLEKFQK